MWLLHVLEVKTLDLQRLRPPQRAAASHQECFDVESEAGWSDRTIQHRARPSRGVTEDLRESDSEKVEVLEEVPLLFEGNPFSPEEVPACVGSGNPGEGLTPRPLTANVQQTGGRVPQLWIRGRPHAHLHEEEIQLFGFYHIIISTDRL
ncbi:unnamed protein product [Pleuronectes platessa]|uniref:Uncharacterized protein n=1 Tax=Pleuronectes platessa TaxID=8262 RepID=A0A9N7TKA2_PLEPL|nr:unnamed protein product [Pleuronectes platessa]